MGALATGGVRVLNVDVIHNLGIPPHVIDAVARQEALELARRERAYRDDRMPLDVTAKAVILVDDGLATGATMRAAIGALRQRGVGRIIVAVPVGAPDICEALRREADEVVCATTREPFLAVGYWYENFEQTSDEEVRMLLAKHSPLPHVA